jgi:hypothetical protein
MDPFDDDDLYDAMYGERVDMHVAQDLNPESSDS